VPFPLLVSAIVLFAGVRAQPARAATYPLWHHLQPGKYAVGYDARWNFDYSRSWMSPNATLPFRPVLVHAWYPVAPQARTPPMTFGHYLDEPRVRESAVRTIASFQRAYSISSLKNVFQGNLALFENLMNTQTAARRGALPAKGRFPLVVYSLGQNDYLEENVVFAEYLASHGYVVVTVPQLGTSERRMELLIDDPLSYDAQVRDLSFALAVAAQRRYVDPARVSVAGMSMGGIYALLVAMNHPDVKAVIGLDASYMDKRAAYEFDQRMLPYYDPMRIKAPVLSMFRSDQNVQTTEIDALAAADRYLIEFARAIHADFDSYPALAASSPPQFVDANALSVRDQQTGLANFELVCRLSLAFLNSANLGTAFTPETSRLAAMTHSRRRDAPTEEDIGSMIILRRYEAAARRVMDAQAKYPGQELFRFKTMNRIAYEFLYTNHAPLAVDMFRLNVLAHPQSAEAYESLAEGYEAIRDNTEAIANYRQALAIDPKNADAAQGLQRLTLAKPKPP